MFGEGVGYGAPRVQNLVKITMFAVFGYNWDGSVYELREECTKTMESMRICKILSWNV